MSEKAPEPRILNLPHDEETLNKIKRSLYGVIGEKIHGRPDLTPLHERVTEAYYLKAIAQQLIDYDKCDSQAFLEELKTLNGGNYNVQHYEEAWKTIEGVVNDEDELL